jgi:hypothetical protein
MQLSFPYVQNDISAALSLLAIVTKALTYISVLVFSWVSFQLIRVNAKKGKH